MIHDCEKCGTCEDMATIVPTNPVQPEYVNAIQILAETNKIHVRPGEKLLFPKEEMTPKFVNTLADLKKALAEQEMVFSIFQAINGISADVYRTVKEDYRKCYMETSDIKKIVSDVVMSKYVATEGMLAWNFNSMDDSLTVYVN